jgi:hypothetical protein
MVRLPAGAARYGQFWMAGLEDLERSDRPSVGKALAGGEPANLAWDHTVNRMCSPCCQ